MGFLRRSLRSRGQVLRAFPQHFPMVLAGFKAFLASLTDDGAIAVNHLLTDC